MTAGIAEKRSGFRKIMRKKACQRAAGKEGNEGNQILAFNGGDLRKEPCTDSSQTGAKAVHIVHEIESIDDRKNPKNGDGIRKDRTVNKESDADVRRGDQAGDEKLAGKFYGRLQLMFVVEPA